MSALLAQTLSVYRVDAERLRELAPTHVVTQVQCEVCAVSLADVEAALSGWTAARPRLTPLNPGSLADVFDDIRARGERPRCGCPRRATRGGHDGADVARSPRPPRGLAQRPRVATIEWLSPLMTAGNWMPELVAMAGGTDLFGAAGSHSAWIGWDELRAADPDVIVAFPCGFALERVRREIGVLTSLPGWSRLRAVAAGRVYLAEGNQYFNRPGPQARGDARDSRRGPSSSSALRSATKVRAG